jgi:hypothetical protein
MLYTRDGCTQPVHNIVHQSSSTHGVLMIVNTAGLLYTFVHMIMLLYTCLYTCRRLYTCLYTCLYTRLYTCLYTCLYTSLYTCLYTSLHIVHMSVYMSVHKLHKFAHMIVVCVWCLLIIIDLECLCIPVLRLTGCAGLFGTPPLLIRTYSTTESNLRQRDWYWVYTGCTNLLRFLLLLQPSVLSAPFQGMSLFNSKVQDVILPSSQP